MHNKHNGLQKDLQFQVNKFIIIIRTRIVKHKHEQ